MSKKPSDHWRDIALEVGATTPPEETRAPTAEPAAAGLGVTGATPVAGEPPRDKSSETPVGGGEATALSTQSTETTAPNAASESVPPMRFQSLAEEISRAEVAPARAFADLFSDAATEGPIQQSGDDAPRGAEAPIEVFGGLSEPVGGEPAPAPTAKVPADFGRGVFGEHEEPEAASMPPAAASQTNLGAPPAPGELPAVKGKPARPAAKRANPPRESHWSSVAEEIGLAPLSPPATTWTIEENLPWAPMTKAAEDVPMAPPSPRGEGRASRRDDAEGKRAGGRDKPPREREERGAEADAPETERRAGEKRRSDQRGEEKQPAESRGPRESGRGERRDREDPPSGVSRGRGGRGGRDTSRRDERGSRPVRNRPEPPAPAAESFASRGDEVPISDFEEIIEEALPLVNEDAVDAEQRPATRDDDDEERPRRRSRRRGRGRGRSAADDRAPSERGLEDRADDDASESEDVEAPEWELGEAEDEPGDEPTSKPEPRGENAADRDDESGRRRRRRRRRGARPAADGDAPRDRDDDALEERDDDDIRDVDARDDDDVDADPEFEADEVAARRSERPARERPARDRTPAEAADFEDEEDDLPETPADKHVHIPTWEDAIEVIVNKNMESRARSPGGDRRGRRGRPRN